jgi:hypothetical protein
MVATLLPTENRSDRQLTDHFRRCYQQDWQSRSGAGVCLLSHHPLRILMRPGHSTTIGSLASPPVGPVKLRVAEDLADPGCTVARSRRQGRSALAEQGCSSTCQTQTGHEQIARAACRIRSPIQPGLAHWQLAGH